MMPQWIIEKKRDGHPLLSEEIEAFLSGYANGSIPDYQMAALAMAIYFQGLSLPETLAFTQAMIRSGNTLDTSSLNRPAVDKHSTGGIGDKISIILAPVAAACGLAVPMISGRGLGITGGTLDKLESIPGYRTQLDPEEFLQVLKTCGCSIIGQTPHLAPADRKLYALRDVTGTVPSIPLITASIMSKKLAEGLDGLVLDVKCGRGAFMHDLDSARALARSLVAVGAAFGTPTLACLTRMDHPLGQTAGNAVEIRECIDVLRGGGPGDVADLTLQLVSDMLVLGQLAADRETALTRAQETLHSGHAMDCFIRMIEAHGGNAGIVDNPALLPHAREYAWVPAPRTGFVTDVDAGGIGRATVLLGAGRSRVTDPIDPAAGIRRLVAVGTPVQAGEPVAELLADTRDRIDAAREEVRKAVLVGDTPASLPPRLIERMEGSDS